MERFKGLRRFARRLKQYFQLTYFVSRADREFAIGLISGIFGTAECSRSGWFSVFTGSGISLDWPTLISAVSTVVALSSLVWATFDFRRESSWTQIPTKPD